MSNTFDIVVPDLGDFEKVEVIEVLVAVGDHVDREDGLITLESDKAAMDVPATDSGVVEALTVAVGDKVSSGDVIGKLAVDGEATAAAAPAIERHVVEGRGEVEEPPAAPTATSAGGLKTILVPDLGDFDDVEIIEVHVSAGDSVNLEDPLITLESDKAAMDIPATAAGTVDSVLVKVGDTVSEGSPIVVVDAVDVEGPATADPPPTRAPAPAEMPAAPPPSPPRTETAVAPQATQATLPAIDEVGFSKAHASPSVRKLARELGVNLVQVKGSGAKNRIVHDDVKAFVKAAMAGGAAAPGAGAGLPKVPVVDFSKFGEIDIQPLTRIQKISGPRLQASWVNLPHVTQHDLADTTELEAKRQELKGPAKERGIGLTPLAFILRACVTVLKEFPKLNASLAEDGKSLVYKKYYHLGFAADTEEGLVVPVIRDADRKDVYELARELGELSLLARKRKLKLEHLQGATFTVSSLGGIGGTAFTPIVNAPEVAILGVSRSSMQPVWNGDAFEPRLMLPLSLSYDHRVIDGAYAVRFTTRLANALSDVHSLLQAVP